MLLIITVGYKKLAVGGGVEPFGIYEDRLEYWMSHHIFVNSNQVRTTVVIWGNGDWNIYLGILESSTEV